MTSDLPPETILDRELPAGRRQTLGFYGKLFGAWAAMGFKAPKLDIKDEKLA